MESLLIELPRTSYSVVESFQPLADAVPDALVIVNADGGIELVNAQTERMFEYRSEELIGQPVELLMPERFRAKHFIHRDNYNAAPTTRPMGMRLDLLGRRRRGNEFPVEISLSPLHTRRRPVRHLHDSRHERTKAGGNQAAQGGSSLSHVAGNDSGRHVHGVARRRRE